MSSDIIRVSTPFSPTVTVRDKSRQRVDVFSKDTGPKGDPGPQGIKGDPGPQGERGVQNLVISPTPPTDTSVVWIDTSQL